MMSKTISSHNLNQMDSIINELRKSVCCARISYEAYVENSDNNEYEIILDDSIKMLEDCIEKLRAFDSCIRVENDYEDS